MIQLRVEEGRTFLEVICDACKESITDADMAMVRFRLSHEDGAHTSELVFCHKNKCDESLDQIRPEDGWWELRHFLFRLATNAGMDIEAFRVTKYETEFLNRLP